MPEAHSGRQHLAFDIKLRSRPEDIQAAPRARSKAIETDRGSAVAFLCVFLPKLSLFRAYTRYSECLIELEKADNV